MGKPTVHLNPEIPHATIAQDQTRFSNSGERKCKGFSKKSDGEYQNTERKLFATKSAQNSLHRAVVTSEQREERLQAKRTRRAAEDQTGKELRGLLAGQLPPEEMKD